MESAQLVACVFSVSAAAARQRLDDFLAAHLPSHSRMHLARRIREGHCQVDGAPRQAGFRLRGGEQVTISVDPAAQTAMTPAPLPLVIHYEDDLLIVVEKPAGMLMHPTRHERSSTLANALAWHWNPQWREGSQAAAGAELVRPGLPHRLDRETSGLVVAARHPSALRKLGQAFAARQVTKQYLAVVDGGPSCMQLLMSAPIGRDASQRPSWRVMEAGKPAQTLLQVLERGVARTLVALTPVTGRTNQLRIHCAAQGFPITGDPLYGGSAFPRLCLHAHRLGFHHPRSQQWLQFCSPPPEDFAAALCRAAAGQPPAARE